MALLGGRSACWFCDGWYGLLPGLTCLGVRRSGETYVCAARACRPAQSLVKPSAVSVEKPTQRPMQPTRRPAMNGRMSFSVIKRIAAASTVLVVLLSLAGVASAAKRVPATGIVIATPGSHGVEIVGKNHQARLLLTRHRAKALRPGAVVRFRVGKKAS